MCLQLRRWRDLVCAIQQASNQRKESCYISVFPFLALCIWASARCFGNADVLSWIGVRCLELFRFVVWMFKYIDWFCYLGSEIDTIFAFWGIFSLILAISRGPDGDWGFVGNGAGGSFYPEIDVKDGAELPVRGSGRGRGALPRPRPVAIPTFSTIPPYLLYYGHLIYFISICFFKWRF